MKILDPHLLGDPVDNDWEMAKSDITRTGTLKQSGVSVPESTGASLVVGSLETAIIGCRAELETINQEQSPLKWAAEKHHLGELLARLGQSEKLRSFGASPRGREYLEGAIDAYREALKERTCDRVPLDWATTMHELGEVYLCLGNYSGPPFGIPVPVYAEEPKHLREAVTAFRRALEERTRNRVPFDWALTNHQLGHALALLSLWERRTGSAVRARELLNEAIFAYGEALQERKPNVVPLDWSETLQQLADALAQLGALESQSEPFQRAINAYRALYLEAREGRLADPSAHVPTERNDYDSALETTATQANVSLPGTNWEAMLVQNKNFITRDGVRYLPLSLAASIVQASESTVRKWIANRIKFADRPIQTHASITKDVYVSEDSVKRMARRFVKWPSGKPAGSVTLGDTDDQSGYLGLRDAAKILQVDHHTLWLWATQGKAPTPKRLDVIKCTVSDYFYIRGSDLSELKKFIPNSGLRRGRRPRRATQPLLVPRVN